MKYLVIILTTIFFSGQSIGQSTEDSIKATINTLFYAMKNADPSLFRSVFSDSAVMQTIIRDKNGKTIVKTENVQNFASFVSQLKKDSADERIRFETIKIDGPLAIVWTPYNFYFNGLFSHCGVNSFQLVRFEEKWKIQYLIDTRRKNNCDVAGN